MTVVVALAPALTAASPGASCAGADVQASNTTSASFERAVVCLVNSYRKAAKRSPLRMVSSLHSAASDYAQRMVSEHFLGHTDPDGETLGQRLLAHRYVTSKTISWTAAENLALAVGQNATARHIVRDWMGSPVHRANVLRRRLHDLGVGAIAAAPDGTGPDPVTVVMDLGSRKQ